MAASGGLGCDDDDDTDGFSRQNFSGQCAGSLNRPGRLLSSLLKTTYSLQCGKLSLSCQAAVLEITETF